MSIKKNPNYKLNNYLYKLDFVNKKNLVSVYKAPSVEYVKFTMYGKMNKKVNSHLILSFYSLILISILPKISSLVNTKSYFDKKNDIFVLNLHLKNKKEIENFTYYFFYILYNNTFSVFKQKNIISFNFSLNNFYETNILSKVFKNSLDLINISFKLSSSDYDFIPSFRVPK